MACQEQEEQKIANSCNKYLSRKALRKAFLLTYDRVRRYEGVWHLEKRFLLPTYVFLESDNERLLIKELKESGNCVTRINPEEEKFLKRLYGDGYHLKMSRGIFFKGATRITEGPLKGMENRICKVDRHKRLVCIRTVMGRDEDCIPAWKEDGMKKTKKIRYISAGLEITDKIV